MGCDWHTDCEQTGRPVFSAVRHISVPVTAVNVQTVNSLISNRGPILPFSARNVSFSLLSMDDLLDRFITVPFLDRDPKAIEIVQVILESILLRREKNMRDVDGKMIVDLPAKEVSKDS